MNKKVLLLTFGFLFLLLLTACHPVKPEDFQYDLKKDGTYELVGIDDYSLYNNISITIPAMYKETQVTSIAEKVFLSNRGTSFTSMSIKNGFEEELKSIAVFQNNLREIIIEEGIEEIKGSAFRGNALVEVIVIPSSVTVMGEDVFKGCENAVIYVNADEKPTGWSDIWNPDDNTVILNSPNNEEEMFNYIEVGREEVAIVKLNDAFYASEIEVPSEINAKKVVFLCKDIFKNEALKNQIEKITIPPSISSLGMYSFNNLAGLNEINFIDVSNITSISTYAFYDCVNLETLFFTSSVASIGRAAFVGCKNLVIYVDDTDDETIYKFTSSKWNYLGVLAITGAVDYGITEDGIKYGVVKNKGYYSITVTGVKSEQNIINIPEKIENRPVTKISKQAFIEKSSLTGVTIPSSIVEIGSRAFYGCTSLIDIEIPEGINIIGEYAFCNCTSLVSVALPEGISIINFGTFLNCTSLLEVVIPNSLIEIGGRAFEGCASIKSITIPDDVRSIGIAAFKDCSSLTSVNIPSGVRVINLDTFKDCSSLTSVVIPDGLSKIRSHAFVRCTALTSIVIPESVTEVLGSAFVKCPNLKLYVYAKKKPAEWSDSWNPDARPVKWGYKG